MNNKTVRSVPRIIIGNPLAVCAPATTSDRRYLQGGGRAAGGREGRGWRARGLNAGRGAAEARRERETLIDDFSAGRFSPPGDLDHARNRTRPVTYLLFLGINAACAALNPRSKRPDRQRLFIHTNNVRVQFARSCTSGVYAVVFSFYSFTSTTALKREALGPNVQDKSR